MKLRHIMPVLWVLITLSGLAQQVDNPHGDLNMDCKECHTTSSWDVIKKFIPFNHDKTGYPLVGNHKLVDCGSCHQSLVFAQVGTQCLDCHTDEHKSELGFNCEGCHTPENWNDQREAFQRHAETNFPLVGAHAISDCESCHFNQQENEYTNLPLDCDGCHIESFAATVNPDHQMANFSTRCEKCHNQTAVIWSKTEFKHPETFPLRGSHFRTDCASCHADQFAGTPEACVDCHRTEFQSTTEPDHQAFGFREDCAICHNEVQWEGAEFDHVTASNGFELIGVHAETKCTSCHVDNQVSGFSRECLGCHESNYNEASNPNHAITGISTECQECHTPVAWSPSSFDHNSQTSYVLSQAHSQVDCSGCHQNGNFSGTPTDCWSCHEQDFRAVQDPDHVAGNYPHDCLTCHSENRWTPAEFDHDRTNFPLTGAHITVDCADCHSNNQYTGTPTDCFACHESDFNGTTDPDHQAEGYPTDCVQCHNTTNWNDAEFNHDNTAFPLTGAHITVDCASCHTNGYSGTPTDCFACHESDFNGTTDPDHQAEGYPTDCTQCHNTTNWNDAEFNHDNTSFPLTGAHVTVDCADCHTTGYSGTPTDCFACHESDFNGTTDPDHQAEGYPTDCLQCHNTTNWNDAEFNHDNTAFPLTGAHITVDCADCHTNNQYTGTPTDCWSCHDGDFNGTTDPNHQTQNFSHDCTECHSTNNWGDVNFDHSNTNFQLTGAHISVACADCHTNGYANTPADCWSCHDQDFNGVTDPSHTDNQFSHLCEDCHTTQAWSPASFDHSVTNFPLTGAHDQILCIDCHTGGNYDPLPVDCWSCHDQDFNNVTDPNHQNNQFSHLCEDCHTTQAWSPSTFDHDLTNFPLDGAHDMIECIDCHAAGDYNPLPVDCWSCHEQDFNNVTDPNHVTENFNHDCTECHNTSAWDQVNFDHRNTNFPLTGAHITLGCADCHGNGYTGTPTDCWSCHQGDYESTVDPNHVLENFNHDCTECHSTSNWNEVDFNHSGTNFPLDGAHTTVPCADCHITGYSNTPVECFACHEANYNSTTNPNHSSAGFLTQCQECHNTAVWNDVTWDHDNQYFPIYTGKHRNEWTLCADCHVTPDAWTQFECIFCHEHRQTRMDDKHSDVTGYVYQSSACYDCHPDGREKRYFKFRIMH